MKQSQNNITTRTAITQVALAAIHFYRSALRPLMPWGCKFYPSCSAYALESIAGHGLWRGLGLTLRRLVRCRPGVFGGYDPVPDREEKAAASVNRTQLDG